MSADAAALAELLHFLRLQDYRHTAVTPRTHEIVISRALKGSPTLSDIFGWNRPFDRSDLDPRLCDLLERADAVEVVEDGRLRTNIRIASLGSDLFVHSAFPTDEKDAVFFGPDTYRFVRFLEHQGTEFGGETVVDMGTGSGAGGIVASRLLGAPKMILVDINPKALGYAQINAAAAGVSAKVLQSDRVPACDLLIGNAPYLMDESGRDYRHGGELLGGAVSLHWIEQGLRKVRPGGTILLYTGAAYVGGESPLISKIEDACRAAAASIEAHEIDPDVFGEQLLQPGYGAVERIAALGITVRL